MINSLNICYGKDVKCDNSFFMDRKALPNPHMMILGGPGTGKTHNVKKEINQITNKTNDDILVLTGYEQEYTKTELELFKYGEYAINPMDVVLDSTDVSKMDLSIAESNIIDTALYLVALLQGVHCLSSQYTEIISKACVKVFRPFIENLATEQKTHDFGNNPTFVDVCDAMFYFRNNSNGIYIDLIAKTIEPYKKYLSAHTSISDHKRLCLGMHPATGAWLHFISFLQLTYAANKIKLNGHARVFTWLYVDEAWWYSHDRILGEMLYKINRSARPHYGIITLIYQSLEDERSSYVYINANNIGVFQIYALPYMDKKRIETLFSDYTLAELMSILDSKDFDVCKSVLITKDRVTLIKPE